MLNIGYLSNYRGPDLIQEELVFRGSFSRKLLIGPGAARGGVLGALNKDYSVLAANVFWIKSDGIVSA